jgi:copper chaperone CopZ
MNTTIEIQNLKCSGCEATIINILSGLNNIDEVLVNHENGSVTFKYNTPKDLEIVKKTLSKLGYPQVGEQNKFPTKAKSYVSCAIGRINK